MKNLVIFASGAGTNAAHLIDYFKNGNLARVKLIVCNKPQAGVLHIARREDIPTLLVTRDTLRAPDFLIHTLQQLSTDLVILAGFLWKIPAELVKAFPNRIINIHPALLPNYGGKGMYGAFVHEAVVKAGDLESGITIHYVNEKYDEGEVILRKTCPVTPEDTPESLAQKVHLLEYEWYPRTIEKMLLNQKPA